MNLDISSFELLEDAAAHLLRLYPGGGIFTLEGELGSGKTTFVSKILKFLEFTDQVSSPTYSLVNVYEYQGIKIHHLDLYRLKSIEEAYGIGIEEMIEDCDYCFIEWPKIIENILEDDVIKLYFSHKEGVRTLSIHKT